MTPADHIARAKSEALNGDARYATAHALIAIAELLCSPPPTSSRWWESAGWPTDDVVDAHVCEYDDVRQCGWPGHRR